MAKRRAKWIAGCILLCLAAAVGLFPARTVQGAEEEESSKIVVALDPGHDSSHSGTHTRHLAEEVLTLKIAEYCKEELEKYEGVEVYMTRTKASCPYPSTKSSGEDIAKRVSASVSAGASVYVALHLNDAGSSSSGANGAEVLIQNNNWKPGTAAESKKLAQSILDELGNIGLKKRTIYSRTTDKNVTYPNGSRSDYFSVHRNTKKAGIPGIIVEHAYQSSAGDVAKYLSSAQGLKKLGVADAKGIANYLGVTKKSSDLKTPVLTKAVRTSQGVEVKWKSVNGALGYSIFRRSSEGGGWKRIATTTSTRYTDTTKLKNGREYSYSVRAYRASRTAAFAHKYDSPYWSGRDSEGLQVITLKTPELITPGENSESGITVSWKSVRRADGYAVFRKKAGGEWTLLGTTKKTRYTDSRASAGQIYYYTVKAYTGKAKTALKHPDSPQYWSGCDETGVKARFLAAPGLSSVSSTGSGVKIKWKKVSGAAGYAVYRRTSGGEWEKIGTTTERNYTDSARLKENETYFYTVRAYRGSRTRSRRNQYSSLYWSGCQSDGLEYVRKTNPES